MKLSVLKSTVITTATKFVTAVKNPSPVTVAVMGGVGVLVGVALTVRATIKISEGLDELNETLDEIHQAEEKLIKDHEETGIDIDEAMEDLKAARRHAYWHFGWIAFKSVVPVGVSVGGALGAFGWSVSTLNTSNATLTAVATSVLDEYNQYRARVIADQGEEADRKYLYGEPIQVFTMGPKYDENGNVIDQETQTTLYYPDLIGTLNCKIYPGCGPLWRVGDTRQEVIDKLRMVTDSWIHRVETTKEKYLKADEMLASYGQKETQESLVLGTDVTKFREEGRSFELGIEDVIYHDIFPGKYPSDRYNAFMSGVLNELPFTIPSTGIITHLRPSIRG